jgi:hypothetical protein
VTLPLIRSFTANFVQSFLMSLSIYRAIQSTEEAIQSILEVLVLPPMRQ